VCGCYINEVISFLLFTTLMLLVIVALIGVLLLNRVRLLN
jgi:hypothetical protein